MGSMPGFKPRPHWWEASALTAVSSLFPLTGTTLKFHRDHQPSWGLWRGGGGTMQVFSVNFKYRCLTLGGVGHVPVGI